MPTNTPNKVQETEVKRRRTFAIIAHPDAGKTTLTEKLLLYGGAIHLAGEVKAKANRRHTTSDWMEIEKQRGISVSTSALRFEYEGTLVNLLDTPGHKDFSEDTYRTLSAADSAVMIIDAAKGVEPQTRKLFEVCRMRNVPIFTFINKLDRPGRSPIDLIDELEKVLGIRSCPINWPIGMGDSFKGIFDRQTNEVLFFERAADANAKKILNVKKVASIEDPEFLEFIGSPGDTLETRTELHRELKEEIELLEVAGDPFNFERIEAGELTPVFFGSAMNNFGLDGFLRRFIELAPSPSARPSKSGPIDPLNPEFSGFIFKIQANMDPKHRDRVVFVRVCSGTFTRGMTTIHTRTGKEHTLSRAFHFFAQDREIIEKAWPGDIVGLIDTTGDLRIGDTLSTNKTLEFNVVPRFSPEFFCGVTILDPMKRKQLKKGLEQLSEEGVIQLYSDLHLADKAPILGAVGVLQFEILQHRIKLEYGVDARLERLPFEQARWVSGDSFKISDFETYIDTKIVLDRDDLPVILFKSAWSLKRCEDHFKELQFLKNPPQKI